ncbi:Regulatory protein PchR [compost metagenome]
MQTEHRALKDGSVSAVFLQIEAPQAAAVLGEEAAEMLSEVARRDGTVFPQVARAIAWQMAGCGLTGPSRDLYMTGKALEMIAHVLQDIGPTAPRAETGSSRWSSRDVECFHAARGVLLANLAAPPSVTDLARQVGTNARKLSQGFADLFGMPVYRFVKASRFEAAKLMLEGGETSVSRVARQFGYQPQHFATEFRRRFGISPGQITGRRA